MDRVLLASCLLAGVAALVQAFLLVLHTWEHARFARRRMRAAGRKTRLGRAAVIVPCKGLEPGLAENLRPLFEQDHHDHELVFVVEAADDPACDVLRQSMSAYPQTSARLLVAGRARACGQKIHGLIRAVDGLGAGVEFLVFLDSDVRPRRDWLRLLLERLDDHPSLGAVTSYRWFVPGSPGLTNWLLYTINSSLACLFTAQGRHLLWGGSWAIRRDVFSRVNMREAWRRQLSDDLVAARVLHAAGLRIKYEPACIVASPLDLSLTDGFTFLRRQYQLTRIYMPGWWLGLWGGDLLGTIGFWLTAGLALAGCCGVVATGWLPAALTATLIAVQAFRGWLRCKVARTCLPDERNRLAAATWFELVGMPLAGLFSLAALAASAVGRRITWRGIRYELDRQGQVVSVSALADMAAHESTWTTGKLAIAAPRVNDVRRELSASLGLPLAR